MFKYTKDFPIKVIPHITENNKINDIIHNYKKTPASNNNNPSSLNNMMMGSSGSININNN